MVPLDLSSLLSPLIPQMQQAHPPSCLSSAVSKGPSLAEAPERRPWLLCRDQGNTFDEVLLLSAAGPVACSRVPLHSLASSTAALISFDNQSGRAVRCLWLDWEGNEVPYSVLKPGESSVYSTWKSHAWVVRELEGARRMCLNDAQAIIAVPGKQTAAIRDAPALVWQDGTHRAFPHDFKQAVRTLLLCCQRLCGPGSPSGSGAAPHLGSLPLDVVRLLIVQLAPTGLWQDGRAAAHPEVQPVAVCSNRAFRKLCKAAVAQCGRLPAPSRTPVDELLKAPKPAAAQPQGLGARLAQLAQGAGLAVGHMLAGPAQQ